MAFVTVRGNGTGLVNINGKDILFFNNIQDRLVLSLSVTGLI